MTTTTDPRWTRHLATNRAHKATLLRDNLKACDTLRAMHNGRGAGFIGLLSNEGFARKRAALVARIEKLEAS